MGYFYIINTYTMQNELKNRVFIIYYLFKHLWILDKFSFSLLGQIRTKSWD